MPGFSTLSPRAKNTLLALLAAGLVLNCFPLALLPSLDFLFGSIAVLIVVHLFGTSWGTLAGAVAGLYTLHLWNHPYGLILLATEALFIGLLRGKSRNMLLLDGIYWLLVGMPLVWIFYSYALHAEPSTVRLVMVKDAVNGIFNALIASLLVMYQPLRREIPLLPQIATTNTTASGIASNAALTNVVEANLPNASVPNASGASSVLGRMSLSQAIFNLSVGCALLPALLLTIMSARQARGKIESGLQSDLQFQSASIARSMEFWRSRRVNLGRQMAEMAARAQLQPSSSLRHDITLSSRPVADLREVRLVALPPQSSSRKSSDALQSLLYARPFAPRQAVRMAQPPAAILRKLQTAQGPFVASNASSSDVTPGQRRAASLDATSLDATSPNATALNADTTPQVYAPIRRGGVVRGFLVLRFDAARLQEIIGRTLSSAVGPNSTHSGATAYAALIDERNRVIAGRFADDMISPGSVQNWSQRAPTKTRATHAASTGAASTGAASTGAASTGAASTGAASTGASSTGAASPVESTHAAGVFAPARSGRVERFAGGAYQWSPRIGKMPPVELSRHSILVRETRLDGLPWTLVASSALEPQLRSLRSASFDNLLLMLLLSFASLILAQVLSMSLTRPLSRLADVTTDLPLKLIGPKKPDIAWPDTPLEELDALVRNFKSMSSTLQENFRQIQSARRRLEEEQTSLQEANRLKDEFLAVLSHELRTPLVPIIGYADLITRGALQGDETIEAAQAIERNARAQLRLIEDLLDVSRIISGKMRLEIGPLHLETLVHDALDTVHHAAQDKDIHMALRVQENLPIFYGDSARLKQILWNLLSNAVKFTPSGGRVEVTLDQLGRNARLSITDSGQGISAEFLPFIFDRFRQAAEHLTRSHGGLGLGLAIVRHLVEAHGGHIEARSEGEGRGTAFLITLPFQAPDKASANTAASNTIGSNTLGSNTIGSNTLAAPSSVEVAPHMSTHAPAEPARQTQNTGTSQAESNSRSEKPTVNAQAASQNAASQNAVSRSDSPLVPQTKQAVVFDSDTRDEADNDQTLEDARIGDARIEALGFDEGAFAEGSANAGALDASALDAGALDASVQAAVERAALELSARLGEEPHLNGATGWEQDEDVHAGVGRLQGARVLVVDDEADNRGLLGAIIRLEGGHVTVAASGGEGLLLAQNATPSVIVSDIGMPSMDGYEFLQKLRAVESLKDVPVVAFTAHADGRDRVRSLQSGFNAYLSKPAQAEDVIDVIESLCQRHGE